MIERFSQECFFYKTSVKEHNDLKPVILANIENLGKNPLSEDVSHISNTDWQLPSDADRSYMNIVYPLFIDHFKEIEQTYGWWYKQTLSNFWYQQYEHLDYHNWHIHPSILFSSVYYLELPEGSSGTEFKTPQTTFRVEVKEGEILTFPSIFFHRSTPNKSTGRKTIIASNWDAVDWSKDVLK
jgi:hypothetical protein